MKKVYVYFINFAVYTTDNLVTEMSAVREVEAKFDSKENIDAFVKDISTELNTQLIASGVRATNVVIKNFILINERTTDNAGLNHGIA